MGGAGGFMQDGNKRHQHNRSLLSKKGGFFNSIDKYQGNNKIERYDIKGASDEEISRVKKIVKVERKKEVIRRWKILAFSIVGGLLLTYLFHLWLMA